MNMEKKNADPIELDADEELGYVLPGEKKPHEIEDDGFITVYPPLDKNKGP
jgi:hypothetical protein